MTIFILNKSKSKSKKYDVYEYNTLKKVVSFGASGYSDYPTHKDEARKERYLKRHQKEDHGDLSKAGTWARFILWNKPSLEESILDMEHRFRIKILT